MNGQSLEKIALLIVGVALVTTLVLPDRKTAQVVTAFGNVFNNALATATAQRR